MAIEVALRSSLLDTSIDKITATMSKKTDQDFHENLAVEEARAQLKRPSLYKVILLNDDYTPMDFVIHIDAKHSWNPGQSDKRKLYSTAEVP